MFSFRKMFKILLFNRSEMYRVLKCYHSTVFVLNCYLKPPLSARVQMNVHIFFQNGLRRQRFIDKKSNHKRYSSVLLILRPGMDAAICLSNQQNINFVGMPGQLI